MNFKKLALAAAVAVAPMSALALEPMQDEALSGVTGQDGISIGITTNITTDLFIEDTDGHADIGTAGANAGFIAIQGVNVSGDINLEIDSASALGNDGTGGVLLIGVELPNLSLSNLSLGVTGSSAAAGDRVSADGLTRVADAQAGTVTEVLALGSIDLNGLEMDIQLGPDAANFLQLAGTVDDIAITDFTLNDTAGGGSIYADSVNISQLVLDGTTVSVDGAGMQITLGAGVSTDVTLMGLGMGDASDLGGTPPSSSPIGNVYLTGLDLGGTTVSITGH